MFDCIECGKYGNHVTDRCERCSLEADLRYAIMDGFISPEAADKILVEHDLAIQMEY